MNKCFAIAAGALLLASTLAGDPIHAATKQDQEDISATILRYKSAIQVNPKNPDTRCKLAEAYLAGGQIDSAMEQFRKTIDLDPMTSAAYIGLARTQIKKRD